MPDFRLSLKCSNAAFTDDSASDEDRKNDPEIDGNARRAELARILRNAAKDIEEGSDDGNLFDVNGNRVGNFITTGV